MHLLLFSGYVLLPFSTAPSDGGVVSFGLPLLAAYSLLLIPFIVLNLKEIPTPAIVLGGGYVFSMGLSLVFAPELIKSIARFLPNLLGFFIFLGSILLLKKGLLKKVFVLKVFMIFGGCLASYYIINFYYQSINHGLEVVLLERYTGGLAGLPWGASNVISAVLFFSIFATIQLYAIGQNRVYLLFILMMIVSIILTLSRAGLILLLISFVFSLFSKNMRKSFAPVLLSVFTLAFILLLLTIGDVRSVSVDHLIQSRISSENITSVNSRFDSWLEKIEYISRNPFGPIGYYGSLFIFDGLTSHNFLITSFLEMSFLGLFFGLCIFLFPFICYYHVNSCKEAYDIKYLVLGLFIVLINLQFEDANYTQPYIFSFWLYLALIYVDMSKTRCRIHV